MTAVSPWQASRYMMAKTSHTAIRAGIVTLLIIPSFYLFIMFAAYAVNLINPDIEPNSQVFIWAAYNVMPTAVGVILVTGIVAAGLSSASAVLRCCWHMSRRQACWILAIWRRLSLPHPGALWLLLLRNPSGFPKQALSGECSVAVSSR